MSRIWEIHQEFVSNYSDFELSITVHDGKFHLDELMAITLVRLAGINISHILRTRNEEEMNITDIVFDVGGKNDGRFFDHHQRDFKFIHGSGVKFATCGLVWDDLKEHILDNILPKGSSQKVRYFVLSHIYERLVLPTDASDTGSTGELNPLTPLILTEIVGSMNSMDPFKQNEQFMLALELVNNIVKSMINQWVSMAQEQDKVLEIMKNQSASEILVLDEPLPWISVALDNWEETKHFKLCVFPDVTNKDQWRVQTFPGLKEDSFLQRCSAPYDWKGLREGQFPSDLPFADKMVFVHLVGFIGGIRGTKEDAISMASYWINNHS